MKSDWISGLGTNFSIFILAQECKGKISLTIVHSSLTSHLGAGMLPLSSEQEYAVVNILS